VKKKQRVMLTGPALRDLGGVASYYNAVLPGLKRSDEFDIDYLEIGSTFGQGSRLYFLKDQIKVWKLLRSDAPDILHVNASLNFSSFIRDGLIIWQA
jgi:hypothetical protein